MRVHLALDITRPLKLIIRQYLKPELQISTRILQHLVQLQDMQSVSGWEISQEKQLSVKPEVPCLHPLQKKFLIILKTLTIKKA